MNLGRHVVIALALAAALAVVAGTVSHVAVGRAAGGWFMYDPGGSEVPFAVGTSDGDAVRVAGVWLIAIAIWFGVAWRLFRSRPDGPTVPGSGA